MNNPGVSSSKDRKEFTPLAPNAANPSKMASIMEPASQDNDEEPKSYSGFFEMAITLLELSATEEMRL